MRRIDISSGDLHITLDLDNEEAVRAHVTILCDELSRLRASLAAAEKTIAEHAEGERLDSLRQEARDLEVRDITNAILHKGLLPETHAKLWGPELEAVGRAIDSIVGERKSVIITRECNDIADHIEERIKDYKRNLIDLQKLETSSLTREKMQAMLETGLEELQFQAKAIRSRAAKAASKAVPA